MYNTVMLIGRLTADPEVNKSENKKDVSHITLAVQRSYKNPDGIYEADFIRCTLWDQLATRVKEYCKKGDLISVRGQIKTSSYELNGASTNIPLPNVAPRRRYPLINGVI